MGEKKKKYSQDLVFRVTRGGGGLAEVRRAGGRKRGRNMSSRGRQSEIAKRRETHYPTDDEIREGGRGRDEWRRIEETRGVRECEEFRKEGRSLDLSSIEGCSWKGEVVRP